jgi:BlaI family transcriptional regulator, penicillinase repressor
MVSKTIAAPIDSLHSNSLEFVERRGIRKNQRGKTTMARPASQTPTDGELEILRVLWARGPASLGDVCEALRREREVATTTVATMLRVMLDKNLVRRKRSGRGHQWSAAVTHAAAARSMIGKLVDGIFDGSAHRLVTHLVEGGELSINELAELRTLIESGSGRVPRKSVKAQKN